MAGRSLLDQREPEVAEFQRIHEHVDRANCSHPPNHRGIPETVSSAGDPLLKRNPASLPPRIQQENHSIDGVFTQPGPVGDIRSANGSTQENH
jgi:hypothetical protein